MPIVSWPRTLTEPRRLPVTDRDVGNRIDATAPLHLRPLVDARGSKHVGAGTLHEFEIIGIIYDPGGVGVLIIDRQREAMLAAGEAAAIRTIEGPLSHPAALASRRRSRKERA